MPWTQMLAEEASGIAIRMVYNPASGERISRDLRGRFTSAQSEARGAFERLAIRLQEEQVKALHQIIDNPPSLSGEGRRAQRGTHYLEDALVSPTNRELTIDGFVVGIDAALDESPAGQYWRGLEEGTSVHIGQKMYGLWNTPSGLQGPETGGRDAIGFTGWRNVGDSEDYRDERGKLPGFRIHNPILAYHYMRTGIRNFVETGIIEREMLRAVQRAGLVQETAITAGTSTAAARSGLRAGGQL